VGIPRWREPNGPVSSPHRPTPVPRAPPHDLCCSQMTRLLASAEHRRTAARSVASHPALEERLSGGTRFGRGQLTRIPLLEPCRSPPGSSCRHLATISSDSLTYAVADGGSYAASQGGPAPRRGWMRAGADDWGRRLPQPSRGVRRMRSPTDSAAPHTFVPNEALAGSRDAAPLQPPPIFDRVRTM
jgi:hypothetical protein